MTRAARALLALAVLASLALLVRDSGREAAAVPGRIRRALATTARERELAALTDGGRVPRLARARSWLEPAVADGVLAPQVVYVAPGMQQHLNPAVRGATVLIYLLAPDAWVVGLPLELLEQELAAPGPPGRLLREAEQAPVILVAGVPPAAAHRLAELARTRYGRPVLVPGRSDGDSLHTLLRFDVAAVLEQGGPRAERYRSLAPR